MAPPSDGASRAAAPGAVAPPDQGLLDSLARGLAAAMQDPSVRQQVLADLRDSPFERHTIHLTSYVLGARGVAVAQAVARQGGPTAARIASAAAAWGGVQLRMAGSANRARWTGDADVLVAGTPLPTSDMIRGARPATAYAPGGDSVRFGLDEDPGRPLFLLQPATVAFGPTPEHTRAAAPRQSRATISTFDDELRLVRQQSAAERLSGFGAAPTSASPMTVDGDPDCQPSETDEIPRCPEQWGGGVARTFHGITLPSGRGWLDCTRNTPYYDGRPITDQDNDGWDDGCENELADTFRPTMAWDINGDCNIQNEPYHSVRGYTYSVSLVGATTVQLVDGNSDQPTIFYAIGYDRDCGTFGVTGHVGDSEFIVLRLAWARDTAASGDPTRGKWFVHRAFLSAHWNTDGDSSGDYDGRDLEYRSAYLGRPRIWSAKGKHGNYRSRSVCDAGSYRTDTCDNNTDLGFSFEIVPQGNLGQSSAPLLGDQLSPVYSRRHARGLSHYAGYEYFWFEQPFSGWDPAFTGATVAAGPYRRPLLLFGF